VLHMHMHMRMHDLNPHKPTVYNISTHPSTHAHRSVSAAPPAYYADLAAQRGLLLSLRATATSSLEELYSGSSGGGSGETAAGAAAAAAAGAAAASGQRIEVRVHPKLGGTMHYL